MNLLLDLNKEKVDKRVPVQCFYCKKVFKNHQALGGHLRAHQEEINSKKTWNYPSHFRNSVGMTNDTQSFSKRHPEIFFGASGSNQRTLFSEVTSPFDFSKRLYSNENIWVNASKFYENNTSPIPPNCSSSSGHAEIQNSEPLSFTKSAPSGTIVPAGVPLDPQFCLAPNGVCQFSTDQFRSFRDGMPSFSANAMPNFQDHNRGMVPYLVNSVCGLYPGLSSNQSLGFKDPNTIGPVPPHPRQSSGQGQIGPYETQTILSSEGGKKRCLGEARGSAGTMNASKRPKINPELQTVFTSEGGKKRCLGEAPESAEMMNALKRPKINPEFSMEIDKPPKRELLLFKDVEECFSGLAISCDEIEEDQTNLDLSLHL